MDRGDPRTTLPWMGAGTEFVGRLVDGLPDDALRGPSALPGWSRAHVVAHLARNAEALVRLTAWARTGVETPMYPSRAQRDADIESAAEYPAARLRTELLATADALDAAFAGLSDTAWRAPVRSALDRPITAADVPWMRVREVWLHAVDLDAGARFEDIPDPVIDALLDDVSAWSSAQPGCPTALLVATDRDRNWPLGRVEARPEPEVQAPAPTEVHGTAAALLGWLTGRTDGAALVVPSGASLPVLPAWL